MAVAAVLLLASGALAASAGTYRGTSKGGPYGDTFPFSLVVKGNRVTKVTFVGTTYCGRPTFSDKVSLRIKGNGRFSGKAPAGPGAAIHLSGNFYSKRAVIGQYYGTAYVAAPSDGGAARSCPVSPQLNFTAKR